MTTKARLACSFTVVNIYCGILDRGHAILCVDDYHEPPTHLGQHTVVYQWIPSLVGLRPLRRSQHTAVEHIARQAHDDRHDAQADERWQKAQPQWRPDEHTGSFRGRHRGIQRVSTTLHRQ